VQARPEGRRCHSLGTAHGKGGEGETLRPSPPAWLQDVGAGVGTYATPCGCSAVTNSGILVGMKTAPEAPTLEQLRRGTPWCWVVCERCLHRTPVAFVPFIIRWGPDASSDMLRRSARCTNCGRKGAVLQHPSWAGMDVGWEPIPLSRYHPG
jgi:hypothetical protein